MSPTPPSWKITSLSWDESKPIWAAFALNSKIPAVSRHLELNAPSENYVPPHRETLEAARKELDRIPLEVAQKLISELEPEFRGFLLQIRPDLKEGLKDTLPKTKQKTTVEDGHINPVTLKALDDHLEDVRALIEEWRDNLTKMKTRYDDCHPAQPIPMIAEVVFMSDRLQEYGWIYYGNLWMNHVNGAYKPLIECLKEHLPSGLWDDHTQWTNKFRAYLRDCQMLKSQIPTYYEEIWPNVRLTEQFMFPVIAALSAKQSEEFFPLPKDELHDDFHRICNWNYDGTALTISSGDRQYTIVEGNTQQSFIHSYEEMISRFLNGEVYADLMNLYREINEVYDKILNSLNVILINRDYVNYRCKHCPAN